MTNDNAFKWKVVTVIAATAAVAAGSVVYIAKSHYPASTGR